MSSSPERWLARLAVLALACSAALAQAQDRFPGVGRPATASEIAAWDIDVRPDFKGLPKGSGSVAKGQDVWESKCASCHGIFGESNEVFTPLVGGTSADDVKTGHVARLNDPTFPGRTTLMKVSTVSTLWDYINRAMPWTAPKSLATDEVYAVTAYLLNMAGVLPDDFVLNERTMAQAQARLPNRNGVTTQHGMWPGKAMKTAGKPDVQASACMNGCAGEPHVASFLPDFARNNHGNLAEQQRAVGPQRGADTSRPAGSPPGAVALAPAPKAANPNAAALALLQRHSCTACHGIDSKIVGPAFRDVASKHGSRADAVAYLTGKIRAGGQGVWGAMPMPPQSLPETEAKILAQWLAAGAKK